MLNQELDVIYQLREQLQDQLDTIRRQGCNNVAGMVLIRRVKDVLIEQHDVDPSKAAVIASRTSIEVPPLDDDGEAVSELIKLTDDFVKLLVEMAKTLMESQENFEDILYELAPALTIKFSY